MPGLVYVVLLGAACCVAGAAANATVFAHAHYDHSSPSIGQVLQSPPGTVDIFTDQDMAKIGTANSITVTDAAGNQVQIGNAVVDDANRSHFSVSLRPDLPPGRYVVSFTTLSDEDNDTDHGRFSFYIGRGPTAQEKQLDTALTQAAPSVNPDPSRSHTALFILGGLVVVLVLGGAIGLVAARRRR